MRPVIRKPKLKHIIWFLIFCIIFAVGYHVTYLVSIEDRMAYPHLFTLLESSTYKETYMDGDEEKTIKLDREYLLSEGDVIEQTFTYTEDCFLSVGARVYLDEDETNEGTLLVELIDDATGEVISEAEYSTKNLDNRQLIMVSYPEGLAGGFMNRELTYRVTVEEMGEDEIYFAMGDSDDNEGASLAVINGEEADDLVVALRGADRQLTYWIYLFKIGAFLLFAAVAWTFWTLALTDIKLQNVFLPVGLAFALIFLVLLPPESVPDEIDHMLESYERVNAFYGLDTEENDTAFVYEEDLNALDTFEKTPTMLELDEIKEHITDTGRVEGSGIKSHTYMHATTLAYLPGVIGIFIARAMGLNGYLVWFAGRGVAILFYLAMMYFAIKTVPVAKAAFFMIAIFPMTIQQCCSYSYDGMIIEAVCVLIAVLLKWIYYKDEKILKREIFFLIYSCLILAVCKGGCYMPLVLLALFIPRERFGDRKKTVIGKFLIVGITGAAWIICTLGYVFYVLAPTGTESTTLSYMDAEAYTVSDVLSNIWVFIVPAVRSIVDDGCQWILSMFGTTLGWLEINVTSWVPIIMSFMILVSLIPVKNHEDEAMIGIPEKVAIVLLCGISMGLIFASMFLDWTPKDASYIWGIQARYFLPLLPAGMLLFRSRMVAIERDLSKYFAVIAVSMYGMVFYDMLIVLQEYLE